MKLHRRLPVRVTVTSDRCAPLGPADTSDPIDLRGVFASGARRHADGVRCSHMPVVPYSLA